MKKHLLLFLFGLASLPLLGQNGYRIEATIKGSNAQEIYLAYHFGSKQFLKDTAKVENGKFVFQGSEPLESGIYLVAVPPKNTYFELLIDDNDQTFSVETDTANLAGNVKVKGSENNDLFYGYMDYLGKKRVEATALQTQMQDPDLSEEDAEKVEASLTAINEEVKTFQDELMNREGGLFVSQLIKSNQEITIPEPPTNPDGSVDSTFRYKYYKAHYFDNLPLSDKRFLRTPLLEKKIDAYMQKMVSPLADSLIKECDYLLKTSEGTKETYQHMLSKLLNDYAKSKIMGHDAVYVHLALNYYAKGKADWVDEEQLAKIIDNAMKLQPLLIGKTAPNLELTTLAGQKTNLNNLKAKYTAVYFWDPDCGNCSKTSDKLIEVYDKYKAKGFEVFGICNKTYKELAKCNEKVEEKGLKWLNTADPYGQGQAHAKYYIQANPTIFLLDENKVIRYKRIDAEQLEEILEREFAKETN